MILTLSMAVETVRVVKVAISRMVELSAAMTGGSAARGSIELGA